MSRLMDHLGLARKKIIKARKRGLSFDPKKKAKIPLLTGAAEWKEEVFREFRKKVEQAKIVIFAVLPGLDEPEVPRTLVIISLWGEILVSGMKDLLETSENQCKEGWEEMQSFFRQPGTAYVTEKEDQTLRYMSRVGISLDEATLTGLETWHMLDQNFCPAIRLEFGHLWVRLTALFRGTSSSG